MCTLILAWRVFDNAPICVAANRDEAVDRPSTPPSVRSGDPTIIAPRDERVGGTWIGYNESGVFVAVTNRWVSGEGERSRGLLVDDALGERSASDAIEHVESEIQRRRYAPFHLLIADKEESHLLEHDDRGDAHHRLNPGIHIVVNVGFDGDWFVSKARPKVGKQQAENAERVYETLQPLPEETASEWTTRAGTVLGDHEFGVCIHGDGFGTRSSSLVRLGTECLYEFADGPPCVTPYRLVD